MNLSLGYFITSAAFSAFLTEFDKPAHRDVILFKIVRSIQQKGALKFLF